MGLPKELYQPSTRLLERIRKKPIKRIRHQVVKTLQITIKTGAKVEAQRETILLVNTVKEKVIHHSNASGDQMQNAASVISLDMKPWFARANYKNRKQMLKLLVKMKKTSSL